MTMAERMRVELQAGAGSARELATRLGWTEKQARNAIDSLRRLNGYSAVLNRADGTFALPVGLSEPAKQT